MRNYFAIAFTLVYLTLAVGVAKTTHYCMGREKHSSLFSFSTKQCPCVIFAKEKMPCCGDEHEILKIEDDHSGTQVFHSPVPEFTLIGETFSLILPVLKVEESIHPVAAINIPPPKVPRYQSLCSLVFYDSIV
ncbi:MAG TPA: hypothetical protein VG737_07045 [Cyclobacteriaceae bacterium]|nr:hypothetical protein [Cyclobacteriaceae bacterium]